MMAQATLPLEPVRRPAARASDPDCSHEAARSISREALQLSQKYVSMMLERGPKTDEEIMPRADSYWSHSRIRTARSELVVMGLVEGGGGRDCICNRQKHKGRKKARWFWDVTFNDRRCRACGNHQRRTRSGRWATVWALKK
jgi:hypothetical protein